MNLSSKADNIRAVQLGLFGNSPRQWQTLSDVLDAIEAPGSDIKQIVVRPRTPGGRCWYDIDPFQWYLEYERCDWFDVDDYYFNEPSVKSTVTMNAEVTRRYGEVELLYSELPDHMRPALRADGRTIRGLDALQLVRRKCDDYLRPVVEELLEVYPDHVIEFTTSTVGYGTLGWHGVVWEVRNY